MIIYDNAFAELFMTGNVAGALTLAQFDLDFDIEYGDNVIEMVHKVKGTKWRITVECETYADEVLAKLLPGYFDEDEPASC